MSLRTSRSSLTLGIAALSCTSALVASSVHADAGETWRSTDVHYNPGAPDVLVLESNAGALFSTDRGVTWHALCSALAGRVTSMALAITSDGNVLFGREGGLKQTDYAGCGLHDVASALDGHWISDIRRDPTRDHGWIATTASNQLPSAAFVSDDDGRSWTTIGEGVLGVGYNDPRFTADGARLYMSVVVYGTPETRAVYGVRYTDDGGQSWTTHPIEIGPEQYDAQLLDLDPLDHERIFVVVRACTPAFSCFNEEHGQALDRVLVSDDSGAHWSLLIEVPELGGFAINAEHIWVSERNGGIWRMDHEGRDPQRLEGTYRPTCLMVRDDDLLVCGHLDFDGYLLARSIDDGETFQPLATPAAIVGTPVCADDVLGDDAGISYAASCAQEWRDHCSTHDLFRDVPIPPRECGTAPRIDAGTDAGMAMNLGDAGCGCQLVGTRVVNHARTGWLALALALLALRFARRRQLR